MGIEVELDAEELFQRMMSAAKGSIFEGSGEIKDFVKIEFKTLARKIKEIGKAVNDDTNLVDLARGKILMRNQITLAAQVISSAAGLAILTVEAAINAVLDVLADFINTALKIPLV